jgi:hypothetical protein
MTKNDDNRTPDGFDLIHSYSRAQAIEDGVLVDVTETAREAGFQFPVALTQAVHASYVEVPEGVPGQDCAGRLWDILWMLRHAIRSTAESGSEVRFKLLVQNHRKGPPRLVTLKSLCGPGDAGEPVITILLPEED